MENDNLEEKSPLVEACHHLLESNGSILGSKVAKVILPKFHNLISALPCSESFEQRQALLGIDPDKSCVTFGRLKTFVLSELGPQLNVLGVKKGHRIALVLPNGPELATAIFGVAHYAACLPLNANGAPSELKKDLTLAKASLIIGLEPEDSIRKLAKELGIQFVGLVPSDTEVGIFSLQTGDSLQQDEKKEESTMSSVPEANSHDDEVLVLFTSGTTGTKKLVPHKLGDMLIAAACIAVSWNLTPKDVNCNLMPLFHVGGICRQVFSPLLSGGSVICCPSFDPAIFWQLLLSPPSSGKLNTVPSWYYAAPTMHQVLLESMPAALETYSYPKEKVKLRMIANAAGGLLPSLAEALRTAFGGANILPSYGMTECMPISSPPFSYQLEKPGTSGVAVGPEISIRNGNTALQTGKEGSICVRGQPCFHGYGNQAKQETFLSGNWFNTGDLGYLDQDGYLYITGRSKEVINRGGEIISPMEVEEEVLQHPSVQACAAFSAKHDVLQEVVGIIIVPAPDKPKVDLPTLYDFLQTRLATAKWPFLLVFMNALPKSHTNKLLRVKLGTRLGLPEFSDTMLPIQRTFCATCPPQGTPVEKAIDCTEVPIDAKLVETTLQQEYSCLVGAHPNRPGALIVHCTSDTDRKALLEYARERLDAYLQPSHICLCQENEFTRDVVKDKLPQSTDAVGFLAMDLGEQGVDPNLKQLQTMMQDLVGLEYLPSPDQSFFQLGGTSLLASQLASRIRKSFGVAFSGADVFRHGTCIAMAQKIQSSQSCTTKPSANNLQNIPLSTKRLAMSKSFVKACIQLLPGFLVYPLWYFTRFFLFFLSVLEVLNRTEERRVHVPNAYIFIATLVSYHFLWNLLTPLLFVALKWIVIGKYKPGRYAFYSSYYLRWWLVDTCRKIFGRGIWGSSNSMMILYYRMLGAKIDWTVRLSIEADIAEYDLVTIGANSAIEFSTVRGFGVDNGAMLLGPVTVGKSATVGIRSVVAPYTKVPDNSHVAAGTSSYEISTDKKHAQVNRYSVDQPNWFWQMFVCSPITYSVGVFSHLPSMYILYLMMQMLAAKYEEEEFQRYWESASDDEGWEETIGDLMEWLCDLDRVPYYLGIRIVRATMAPFLYMTGSLFVKMTIIGQVRPGPRDASNEWEKSKQALAATLFSRENVQNVTDLLGRHYELTSSFYRLLGAKVGKRVFWPGHQPIFSGFFDLLEIGDDVVFGSRSIVLTLTDTSSERVVFCAGANISDNTIVMPGSTIGKNAVLGSNTICPLGRYLPPSSTWVGSRLGEPILLEENSSNKSGEEIQYSIDQKQRDIEMIGDESTLRPFGKAVYLRQANYFVFPGWLMAICSFVQEATCTCFHTLPILGSTFVTAGYFYGWTPDDRDFELEVSTLQLSKVMFAIFCILHFVKVLVGLIIEISAKWILMGRRVTGRYNWDESSYNQRWELYQLTSRIRRMHRISTLDFLAGSPFMDYYFKALGGNVGANCCLYPGGGDPYMPEPDLVTIQDGVTVDIASIVCHLNTRGNFELVPITLGTNSTLRTRSRVQQGVNVESGSMLLEKSLALTGEVIESSSIWQGAPAVLATDYQRYKNTNDEDKKLKRE